MDFGLCADSWLFAGGNWWVGDDDDDGYGSCFTAYVSFYDVHRTEWGRKARARLDEELKEYPHLEVKVKQVTYTRVWIVTAVYILLYLFWFWVYLAV